jgi:mannose-6-phosphate isomerase-like protein (cupin superfamily)
MCTGATDVVVIEDSARVRIMRYTLAPGAATGWHVHALDYVIVPYCDCRVRVETKTGLIEAEMWKDKPYFSSAGAEHNVVNAMDAPLSFLEIELK